MGVDYEGLDRLTGCIAKNPKAAKMNDATIDGLHVSWLVDSGSPYTLISEERARSLLLS